MERMGTHYFAAKFVKNQSFCPIKFN